MTEIRTRIRDVRKRANLTMAEFASAIGVGTSSVSRIERGEFEPSAPVIKAIAAAFCVTETWLRTGEGPMEAASTPAPIISTDPELQSLQEALAAWWGQADEDERTYLRVALRRAVPELGSGQAKKKSR